MYENKEFMMNLSTKFNQKDHAKNRTSSDNYAERFGFISIEDSLEKMQKIDVHNQSLVLKMKKELEQFYSDKIINETPFYEKTIEILFSFIQSSDVHSISSGLLWFGAIFFSSPQTNLSAELQNHLLEVLKSQQGINDPMYLLSLISILYHLVNHYKSKILSIFNIWTPEFFMNLIEFTVSTSVIFKTFYLLSKWVRMQNSIEFSKQTDLLNSLYSIVIHTIQRPLHPFAYAASIDFSKILIKKDNNSNIAFSKFNLITNFHDFLIHSSSPHIIASIVSFYIEFMKKFPQTDINQFDFPFLIELLSNQAQNGLVQKKVIEFLETCLRSDSRQINIEKMIGLPNFGEFLMKTLEKGSIESKLFMITLLGILVPEVPSSFIFHLLDLNLLNLLIDVHEICDEERLCHLMLLFFSLFEFAQKTGVIDQFMELINETSFWDIIEEDVGHDNCFVAEYAENFFQRYHN